MKQEEILKLRELTPEYLHRRLVNIDKKIHKLRLEGQQIRMIIKSLKKK
jgi:hypothetical protein